MDTLNERTAALETNAKNIFHQLDEIKSSIGELHRLTALCEGIMAKVSGLETKLSGAELRLKSLEQAPVEDLRHYRRSITVYLVSALIGALAGALGNIL